MACGIPFGGVRYRRRRRERLEGRKEGGVVVAVAIVRIVGIDYGDAAFLLGGGDKGIVVEGVVRAAKKAGS